MDVLYRKRGIRPSVWAVYMEYDSLRRVSLSHGPDHQQQQDYKSFVEPTESPPVSEMSRSYGRPSARNACRCSFVQRQISFLRLDRRPSQSGQQTVENRPMIRKSLAIYEHGYGCKGISPYMLFMCAIIVAILCFVLFLMYCAVLETRYSLKIDQDMICISFHHGRCIY
jgi:hypothetical protein